MTLAVLLGLGAAAGFGVGDFLSGLYSRRHGIVAVFALSQLAGLLVLGLVAASFWAAPVGLTDLAWGAIGGLAGATGGVLLLHGFRVGRLSVVSPVSSLGAAGLPVVADLVTGRWPSALALAGIGVGLLAIWLVSLAVDDPTRRRLAPAAGVWSGLGAGVGFAGLFLALDRTETTSGPWPAVAAQAAIVAVLVVAIVVRRRPVRLPARALPGVAAAGVAAALATASFVFAARAGFVSVAAVIASLSPAVTVLLARVVLAEHLRVHQLAGLVAAGCALVLIGLG